MAPPPATPPSSITWQLVWCYERCHKAENQEQRQVIKKHARNAGASLVCLKKARQFGAWIDRTKRPPFVLVTDWREAQPCLRAASQHTGTNIPTHMVVLCEGRRQYMRALDWAKVLRPDIGHVHICEKSAIPDWLLDGVIQRCFTPVPSSATEATGDNSSDQSPDDDDEHDGSDAEEGSGPASRTNSLQSNGNDSAATKGRKNVQKQEPSMHIDASTKVAKIALPSQGAKAKFQAPPGLTRGTDMFMSSNMRFVDYPAGNALQEMAHLDNLFVSSQDTVNSLFAGEDKYVVLTHLSM